MNKCIASDVQEMLPDLLHERLDDRAKARVATHVAACDLCRDELRVLRIVKSAAIFAPSIDVDRVARQIPPYRMIVPAAQPARKRAVPWLVAASLFVSAIGGGSVLMAQYMSARTSSVASAPSRGKSVAIAPLVVSTPDGSVAGSVTAARGVATLTP